MRAAGEENFCRDARSHAPRTTVGWRGGLSSAISGGDGGLRNGGRCSPGTHDRHAEHSLKADDINLALKAKEQAVVIALQQAKLIERVLVRILARASEGREGPLQLLQRLFLYSSPTNIQGDWLLELAARPRSTRLRGLYENRPNQAEVTLHDAFKSNAFRCELERTRCQGEAKGLVIDGCRADLREGAHDLTDAVEETVSR